MAEVVLGSNGQLRGIVETRIEECTFSVQFQVRHERIPVSDGSPSTGPSVQIDARQTECGGNQRGGRFSIRAKALAVEKELGVEFPWPPARHHFLYGANVYT